MMHAGQELTCFGAYDIRGRVPDQLDDDVAYRIGRAYVATLGARRTVVGRDVRLTSDALASAVIRGVMDGGSDVVDIGECGTEQVYFNTFHRELDGGIMITASHNPVDFNGMKIVGKQSRPVSRDSGLDRIKSMTERGEFDTPVGGRGLRLVDPDMSSYVRHLLTCVDRSVLRPLTIVTNAGNGGAGAVIDELERSLPFTFVKIHHEPDGHFPHGVPNPLLPENRGATAEAVRRHGADLGLAWDGDFDRCFFFDEHGDFVEGYYLVGLLAQLMLERNPGGVVVHDPRLTWNTIEQVGAAGGTPVVSRTGHAFMKDRMRELDAVYGGEMSAHHYFRDFGYCDSGMMPWLHIAELLSSTRSSLSTLIAERKARFPCSGEINFEVADTAAAIDAAIESFAGDATTIDRTDGVSVEFDTWRFNVRASNTEPLLRLNVETRGDDELLQQRTAQLVALLQCT